MALHVMRGEARPSFARGLQQGLDYAIPSIASGMEGHLNENKAVKRFTDAGVPEHEARVIASLRPQEQSAFYKAFVEAGGGPQSSNQNQPMQVSATPMGHIQQQQKLQGMPQMASPQQQAGPSQLFQAQNPSAGPLSPQSQIASLLGQPRSPQPFGQEQRFPSPTPPQVPQAGEQGKQPFGAPQAGARPQGMQDPSSVAPADVAPVKPRSVAEALQMKAQKAAEKEAQKESAKQQIVADKETRKYYDHVKDTAKNSDDNLKRLGRMEKLIEKGDIPPAVLYKIVDGLEHVGEGAHGILGNLVGSAVGLVAKPLGTMFRYSLIKEYPDMEEFEKISNDFVKGAKQFYGARLTDADLKQFMTTVPTLSQTDNGKKAVIRNLKNMEMTARAENNIMKSIIKQNNNHRPNDLQERVESALAPLKDELAEDFREGFLQGGYASKGYEPLELTMEKK